MQKENVNIDNDGNDHFITISVLSEPGFEENIPVYYGIDGLYSYYSAESTDQYEGATFKDSTSGQTYKVVGQVDLNQTTPSAFTIRHKFGVFDNMQGTDEEGNPTALKIRSASLNPDGYFAFSDGSTNMTLTLGEDGWISIPLQVKQDVFEEWCQEAAKANRSKTSYMLLTDLVIEYNDGYLTGGNINPLPLVYKVSYTASTGGGDGGDGGGDGGGNDDGGSDDGGGGGGSDDGGGGGSDDGGGGGSDDGGGGGGSDDGGGGGGSDDGGGGGGSDDGGGGNGGSGNGGSGNGGGGGGSSSGTTSTGTVQGGPAATPRVTNASAADVGWTQQDGVWYYMDAANQLVTGWLLGPDGRWYFLDEKGVMKTGWMSISGSWYFFNADGAMANGWVQNPDGKWYYLLPDGKMAVDMTTPDGQQVDRDGVWVQ